mgnify:CR=1 FL=1
MYGARKSIQQPATAANGFHLVFDDGQNKGIADQFAPVHHGLRLLAEITASGHLAPQ